MWSLDHLKKLSSTIYKFLRGFLRSNLFLVRDVGDVKFEFILLSYCVRANILFLFDVYFNYNTDFFNAPNNKSMTLINFIIVIIIMEKSSS